MPYLHPFGRDDVFNNRLRTHPQYEIVFYSGSQIINNHRFDGRDIVTLSTPNATSSFVNAFEMNVDRVSASYYDYGGRDDDVVYGTQGKSGELVSWDGLTVPSGSVPESSSYYKVTPFLVKQDNSGHRFRGMSKTEYNSLEIGTVMTSSYPFTSSIDRAYIPARTLPYRNDEGGNLVDPPYEGWGTTIRGGNDQNDGPTPEDPLWNHPVDDPNGGYQSTDVYFSASKRIIALKNVLNNYKIMSPVFEYSSSLPSATGLHKPFLTGALSLISIPSIFYDSGIKKGSVKLEFYFTGSLIDVAVDERQNGELVSTMNDTSGSTVGVVLYNEGFVIMTSTTPILGSNNDVVDSYTGDRDGDASDAPIEVKPNWTYFASYAASSSTKPPNTPPAYPPKSLFTMTFQGTNNIPTMTMFAQAQAGDVNNSQNPTWVSSSNADWRSLIKTTPPNNPEELNPPGGVYWEPQQTPIKNTIQSDFCNFEDGFEKQVFISKIGIFDKERNLIGIAKLANPVLKKETESYTFKLKVDL